jgi:outer membrane protein OmpA-like peptidoglycan-associated protein
VSATKIVISGGGFEFDNLVTAESDQNPTASMVYVTSSSGIAPSTQTITWSPSNTTQEVGNSPATPNALASVTTPSSGGGAISYSVASAGTSGCTVNSSTGVISHTAAGTCVVRASAAAVSGATNYFAATKDVSFVFTASPPNTPGTPTAVAGDASATVTAVAAGSGPTPTSYTVTASPGSATCTITLPATSCVVTGLTNGTSYTFTTTATNGNGTSSASASSSVVTPTAPAPSSNSQPYIPPAPAPIASVTLSKGTKSTSSNVKVRIKDFTGKVIKEIVVPVENTTQTVEFAVDLPYGDFNVEAVAANRYMTSQSVYSSADLVQKNFFEVKSPNRAPVLAGDVLGKPIYFAANSAKLTKAAKTALAELATALRQSDSRVALTGFASKWNKSKTFEQSLATKRSFAVGNYLKSLGVTNWVYYSGFGALTSVDSLPSARKVELRIVK